MGNAVAWPYLRTAKVLFIVLTLCAVGYMGYFFLNVIQNPDSTTESTVQRKNAKADISLLGPELQLEAPSSVTEQNINIFSSRATNAPVSVEEKAPTGQLPSNLKVVGIMIAEPAQVIIEDTNAKATYFISQASPQGGISLERVEKDVIVITYQGQNISLPINQQSKVTVPINAPKI